MSAITSAYVEKMEDKRKIENLEILVSHSIFYKKNRGVKEILGTVSRHEIALKLSILSFSHNEENNFRKWSIREICKSNEQIIYAHNKAIYSRVQIWRFWLALFKEWMSNTRKVSEKMVLSVIHEVFSKLNDRKYELIDDFEQYAIKASITQSRDNRLAKLRRAQKLFLVPNSISPYIESFERIIGVSIGLYINIIYFIIDILHKKREVGAPFMPAFTEWAIDSHKISQITNTPLALVEKIMKEISFNVEEGRLFSRNSTGNHNDFSLFRNRPFLEISHGKYLPIEGKLVEELIFENLFHRIHEKCGRDISFFNKFGNEFERYVQEYVRDFIKRVEYYKIIEEFSYEKGGKKSPDIMVKIPIQKAMIVIEVKSARPLNEILTTDNNRKSIEETYMKIQGKPWVQSYDRISEIVNRKIHKDFTPDIIYYFLCVTMANIPFSLGGVDIISDNINLTKYFYSVDIETFELLMRFSSITDIYSLRDALISCERHRKSMSMKTCISRMIRKIYEKNNIHHDKYLELLKTSLDYHNRFIDLIILHDVD